MKIIISAIIGGIIGLSLGIIATIILLKLWPPIVTKEQFYKK